jgi:hypothetical protein
MIAAEKAGKTPQAFVGEIAAGRKRYLDGFHIASTTGTRPTAREPRLAQGDLPRAAQERADRREDDRAVLRPREVDVPARPLHQGRVPALRREGPVRRLVRGLRRRLLAHRAQEPVLHAERRHPRAAHQRALLLPPLGSALHRLPAEVDDRPGPPAARGAEQDQGVVRQGSETGQGGLATGTSAATRPTSASRSPTRRASTSTSGWTPRSATSPR